MLLVVDADVLVGQLTNYRGRTFVTLPSLELHTTDVAWREVRHELPKRTEAMVRRGARTREEADLLLEAALQAARSVVTVTGEETYAHEEMQARVRIADAGDWPTVALALTLNAGIWTNDRHFFGCGCPTWRMETLWAVLDFLVPRQSPTL